MLYSDNDSKFVTILNAKIAIPQLMNAIGHMTAGLMSRTGNIDQMSFLQYPFHDDLLTPATISLHPFIILKSKNSNQLKTLHELASRTGALHDVFTDSMLGASASEQITATKSTKTEDLTYFGVALFGESKKLAELTHKFSLFNI